MKLVALSDLEVHLVAVHKVNPKLVSLLEENHADKRQEVASTSHLLMHLSGLDEEIMPHTHPEFEDVPEGPSMGIRQISDEELAENKRHYIATFGQEAWDKAMSALGGDNGTVCNE